MFGSVPTNRRLFAAFAGLTLATQASAHLFISKPAPPMEGPIKSPLDPSGSNFPCHNAPIQSSGGIKMQAGSSQTLEFDGGNGANTATHGGGSCQLSVYYGSDDDAEKKDPKNWHVIHSIEGGCPTNSAGNLDQVGAYQCGSAEAPNDVDCLMQYKFDMPKGMKSGHATFAWTWFNTIGNREMYMNCVNAEIEGGDGSEMGSLPSLFVANLQGGLPQCSTQEAVQYKFPHPGKYVTSNIQGSQHKLAMVSGGACADDGAPSGGDAAGDAAPSYGGGAPAAPSGNPGKPPGGNGGYSTGQVTVTTMQTVSSGSSAPTSVPAPVVSSAIPSAAAPAPSSAAAPAPAPYASGSSSNGSGSCPSGAQACSTDGEVVCMGNQWGLCNAGCAVPQSLAAGTHCTNGKIAKRDHVRRHIGGRTHGRQFA